ncbi:MAG: hypothetical protein IKR68_08600 [Lachnospiraceae bacterium]|nr:hypothetical protein [Lachnospiraceae bacterium]
MSEPAINRKNEEMMTSHERLDDYIHITEPENILVVIATLVLLLGGIFYMFYSSLEMYDDYLETGAFSEYFEDVEE